ncbi:alpha/beta hydrolase family protein [Novosphingobium panipatense]|uniref:Uncharacterized protein n=1 Tax=Novosphingobium panipatense TaxID=428991 RepID=A0ABY1Q1Z1_9SPHN|nr:hypothetical protein [Novosphingobium panipatense]SMP56160.1 hypothetical protein SAMN06296065_10294 [Novosphingobium panipatense]
MEVRGVVTPASWSYPLPAGGIREEFAICCDASGPVRLLIVPALFEEGNKLRRLTVRVMRNLADAGIDTFLPDLPGCNESLQDLAQQEPADWLDAAMAAARHFGATHTLGIRGGCMFTPRNLPALHYAPVKAETIMRQMYRARVLSAREAGRDETREALAEIAMTQGITLSGYSLGADFCRHFGTMAPTPGAARIPQEDIGGSGLWLRAEPDDSPAQAATLASRIVQALSQ